MTALSSRYRVTWPEGYGDPAPEPVVTDKSFFSDDNGFTAKQAEEIAELEVGHTWSYGGPFDLCQVERIQ